MKPNYTYNAVVNRIVDGDTIDVTIQLWQNLTLQARLRLAHVNAPESKSSDPKEREQGVKAAKALAFKLSASYPPEFTWEQGTEITAKILGQDKYGRWLAEAFLKNESISDWLIKEGHAKPYEGGARGVSIPSPFGDITTGDLKLV